MNVDIVPTVIYSVMLGTTLLALIDTLTRPKNRQTGFLTGLLVLLSLHFLGELYIYSGAYQYAPELAGAQLPLRVLLGPALYFYAYATMSPEKSLSGKSYMIALSGPLLVLAAMIPFIFGITTEEKLALATPASRDPELWQIALMTCLFSMFVFILFAGSYLVAALKLHARHRLQLMERFSAIEKRSMDWFQIVLLLWGLAWTFYAIEYVLSFLGWSWFGAGVVLPLLEASILIAFVHMALKQSVLKESDKGIPTTIQPRKATLPETTMKQIAEQLKSVMSVDKLFMEEELTLKKLSEAISVSENHISETLSQYLETNFFQFVNGYRVEEAKNLLKTTDSSVSSIAYEVGFNSKSTFNAAFKKVQGLTPTAFRNENKQMATREIIN